MMVVDGNCFGAACGGSQCIVLLYLQRVVVCVREVWCPAGAAVFGSGSNEW